MRHLVSASDLSRVDAEAVLALARAARSSVGRPADRPLFVTLVFLSPSTRTQLGFTAAVARLGGYAAILTQLRHTGDGLPSETLADTVRVASGMSDAVVCRPPRGAEVSALVPVARCPLVNGGDACEHPTQALIDRFAIETLMGPVTDVHLGISGDLRSRTARSMLYLLRLTPPRQLSLFAPHGREPELTDLPPELADVTVMPPEPDFSDLDVLLLPGLAPRRDDPPLAPDANLKWGFSPMSAPSLPRDAIILSPGPVIDEIDHTCINDRRVRVFEQSDLGVAVRIGLLRWLVDQASTA